MKSKANIGVIVDLCEKCPDINLQLTAFDGDASTPVSLFVDGILPSDPLYNTWVWERADKYGVGTAYNTNPIWTSLGTGLITRFAGDDSIVRVRLNYNGCVYYSNVVGYDGDFNSGSTIVTDGTITGNGTLSSPLAVNPLNNRFLPTTASVGQGVYWDGSAWQAGGEGVFSTNVPIGTTVSVPGGGVPATVDILTTTVSIPTTINYKLIVRFTGDSMAAVTPTTIYVKDQANNIIDTFNTSLFIGSKDTVQYELYGPFAGVTAFTLSVDNLNAKTVYSNNTYIKLVAII